MSRFTAVCGVCSSAVLAGQVSCAVRPVASRLVVTPGGMTAGRTATGSLDGGRTRLAPSNPRTVTLPGRTSATLPGDRPGSCRCPSAGARRCVEDHEPDSCDPTRPTTLVARCGGVGAVGADHAQHCGDRLAGSAVAPGRPARTGPAHPWLGRWPRAGVCERDHRRGGAGQPPAPPPGGLAAAGPGPGAAWAGVPPAYAAYGLLARPGALPAAHAVARYWPITLVTTQTAASFALLLTPTGSLPSPRWRWWPG